MAQDDAPENNDKYPEFLRSISEDSEECVKDTLRKLSGKINVEQIESLDVKVTTQGNLISHAGKHLPNLSFLSISSPSISFSLRDLGTNLQNLAVLYISDCSIKTLDGLLNIPKLKELYAANNKISDLYPCIFLEELSYLDVEGNCISDITSIDCLALCPNLKTLILQGNPICHSQENEIEFDYCDTIRTAIPQLQILDGTALFESVHIPGCPSFEADIQKSIYSLTDLEISAGQSDIHKHKSSTKSSVRSPDLINSSPSYGSSSHMISSPHHSDDNNSLLMRPSSSCSRKSSLSSHSSIYSSKYCLTGEEESTSALSEDYCSSLSSLGQALCGNPGRAFRAIRSSSASSQDRGANSLDISDEFSKDISCEPLKESIVEREKLENMIIDTRVWSPQPLDDVHKCASPTKEAEAKNMENNCQGDATAFKIIECTENGTNLECLSARQDNAFNKSYNQNQLKQYQEPNM